MQVLALFLGNVRAISLHGYGWCFQGRHGEILNGELFKQEP